MCFHLRKLVVSLFIAGSLASSLISRVGVPATAPATTRPALHFLTPMSVDVTRLLPMPPKPDTLGLWLNR